MISVNWSVFFKWMFFGILGLCPIILIQIKCWAVRYWEDKALDLDHDMYHLEKEERAPLEKKKNRYLKLTHVFENWFAVEGRRCTFKRIPYLIYSIISVFLAAAAVFWLLAIPVGTFSDYYACKHFPEHKKYYETLENPTHLDCTKAEEKNEALDNCFTIKGTDSLVKIDTDTMWKKFYSRVQE